MGKNWTKCWDIKTQRAEHCVVMVFSTFTTVQGGYSVLWHR